MHSRSLQQLCPSVSTSLPLVPSYSLTHTSILTLFPCLCLTASLCRSLPVSRAMSASVFLSLHPSSLPFVCLALSLSPRLFVSPSVYVSPSLLFNILFLLVYPLSRRTCLHWRPVPPPFSSLYEFESCERQMQFLPSHMQLTQLPLEPPLSPTLPFRFGAELQGGTTYG